MSVAPSYNFRVARRFFLFQLKLALEGQLLVVSQIETKRIFFHPTLGFDVEPVEPSFWFRLARELCYQDGTSNRNKIDLESHL